MNQPETRADHVARAADCARDHCRLPWKFPKRLDQMTEDEQALAGQISRLLAAIQFIDRMLNDSEG